MGWRLHLLAVLLAAGVSDGRGAVVTAGVGDVPLAVDPAPVMAIVFGLHWLRAGRRAALLVFSLLCLCVALLQGLTAPGAGQSAEEAPREWRHPLEWAPPRIRPSVERWFAGLPPRLQYSELRFQAGDDARWAAPGWDDRAWRVRGYWDLPARSGIFWVRFRVRMGGDGAARLPTGVMISTVTAYELFWDGVKLGSSGVPGPDRFREVPGYVDRWFSLPGDLTGPGEHVVALRLSSHRCGFPSVLTGLRLVVDESDRLQRVAVREAVVPTLAAGATLMAGLAGLIMWTLAARRTALLVLTGMCLSAAAMQALHAYRWFFQYPADWHYPALVVMSGLVGVQSLCLVVFLLVHFAVPGTRWLPAALLGGFGLVAWLSPERMNLDGVRILALGLLAALVCAGWAVWRRRRGAWLALLGVLASGAALALEPGDYRTNFFIKFLPATLGLTMALAVELREERRAAQAVKRAAARLELELLKKNIQPHFLLNTLATIQETIEQEPRTAAALVEALAGEFRILSRVAGEKLIPLAQELRLCRAHLQVMSLRKEAGCTLGADGVRENTLVPPALFHTLIENGLTHLAPREGRYEFELRQAAGADGVHFVLTARGVRQDAQSAREGSEGTGLRYIKARLEESFPGRWTLSGGPVPEGWRTEIGWRGAAGEELTPPRSPGGLEGASRA